MKLSSLANAGRTPPLPLTVELAGEPVVVDTWLRTLPGQRYVGRAMWRGQPVLAKLLVGGKALRHHAREAQGAAWLAASGLATPKLLAQGTQENSAWLLFEFLSAQSLGDLWSAVADEPALSDAQQAVLAKALESIAKLHAKGLWQDDLHLDNLLEVDGHIHWIDGGAIGAETIGQPLSREQVLKNLGVFFAQLPVTLEPFIEELLIFYIMENSAHALPLEALLKHIQRARQWRLNDYLKKVGRDCSLFSAKESPFGLKVCARQDQTRLASVLASPDHFVAVGELCKNGNTATVAKFELDSKPLVIKRYNIKNLAHWLSRFWRPSRAFHSWVEGHRLMQLGIATAKPLAIIEQRFWGFRAKAWLVNEALEGPSALSKWSNADELPDETEINALVLLFEQLINARISHGDLKGTNLFWDGKRWVLIDLDSMQQHSGFTSFKRAYQKDRDRFLRNWPKNSQLYQHLDQLLPVLSDDL